MNFIIRNINKDDYKKGYLDLLFELSNFKTLSSQNDFEQYLKSSNAIIRVIEYDNKLIGAGSLFILNKLHCNPFGQIEDVVITKEFCGQGLGKKLIDHLVEIGFSLKCYKICLNSLETNKNFYLKCNFIESGIQFKRGKNL